MPAIASARARAERGVHAPPHPRVLVVEDDCLIASALVDDLKEFGFSVVGPAADLAHAVAIASTAPLDCALVDVALCGESALPVAEILAHRHLPFVFMTGDDAPLVTFQDVPVLMKPFTVEELRFTLRRILSPQP